MSLVREFMSLGDFALHLAAMATAVEVVAQQTLGKAARLIEREAKAEIGHYQPATAHFAAWAPLADATVEDRVRKGYSPDEPLLREGTLRDSIGHQVSGLEALVGSTSDIAVYQELGTSTIPPRAFLGPAAIRKKEQIEKLIGAAAANAMQYGAEGAWTSLED